MKTNRSRIYDLAKSISRLPMAERAQALSELCGEDRALQEELELLIAKRGNQVGGPAETSLSLDAETLVDGLDGEVTPAQPFSRLSQTSLRRLADQTKAPTIAVLPLVNLGGDERQAYLGDGISEELIHELTGLSGLQVAARTSSFRFKESGLTTEAVGRKLGVRWVLAGSFEKTGDCLSVQVRLVETASGEELWRETVERQTDEVFELQAAAARSVVLRLRGELMGPFEPRRQTSRPHPGNRRAYELCLKGRFYWHLRHQKALDESLSCFQAAAEADPSCVMAHIGIADACWSQAAYLLKPEPEILPLGRLASLRALELDESVAEAHVSRGAIALFELDWRAAEENFQRAIRLNEECTMAHGLYGLVSGLRHQRVAAAAQAQRSMELEPMSQFLRGVASLTHYFLADYPRAVQLADEGLALDSSSFLCLWTGGLSLMALKRPEDGLRYLEKATEHSQRAVSAVSWLAYGYGQSGQRGRATVLLDELRLRSQTEFVHKAWLATVRLGLGELEEAERLFAETLYEGAPSYVFALYGRPFPTLLDQIGLRP